jgi:hypothetical protein
MIWGAGLTLMILGFNSANSSIRALLLHGLSLTNTDPTIGVTGRFSITTAVLLANLPQVVISFAYLYYNNVLTCMLFAYEWSQMAKKHQPLRVSRPRGEQRSTYYLQLPYVYILPLMAAMSCLHWLVARSIFLLQVKAFDNTGAPDPSGSKHNCGYSPFAILMALCVGAVVISTLIGLSWTRKLCDGIPVVGSCSAAISAACHVPSRSVSTGDGGPEDYVPAANPWSPLKYGVMSSGKDAGGRQWQRPHAGFASGPVMPLQDGVHY